MNPNDRDPTVGMEEALNCCICFSRVDRAQMCPHCSAIACFSCIRRWLLQHPQCPACRHMLDLHDTVNCRVATEMAGHLDRLHTQMARDNNENCIEHGAPLYYLCTTCEVAACADCAMFGTHKGHDFEHLEKVYNRHVAQIKLEAELLKRQQLLLSQHLITVEENMQQLVGAKEDAIEQMQQALAEIISRLNKDFQERKASLEALRLGIEDEARSLEAMLEEIERHLSMCPKSVLISKCDTLVSMLQELRSKNPIGFELKPLLVPTKFPSELLPEYETAEFVMKEFSRLQKMHELVYSPPLSSGEATWRLKVYPAGNESCSCAGEFLSVYLEMITGPSSKYQYRIEAVRYSANGETTQSEIREGMSDFEPDEAWGFPRFLPLDRLESEGFWNASPEEDFLLLRFSVRSPSWYYRCVELERTVVEQRIQLLRHSNALQAGELPLTNEGNESFQQEAEVSNHSVYPSANEAPTSDEAKLPSTAEDLQKEVLELVVAVAAELKVSESTATSEIPLQNEQSEESDSYQRQPPNQCDYDHQCLQPQSEDDGCQCLGPLFEPEDHQPI